MEHSNVFPPSGSERGIICPASVQRQGDTPTNLAMATGTAVHWISEYALRDGSSLELYKDTVVEVDGYKIKITDELLDVATYYCDYVRDAMSKNPDAELKVESRVDLSYYGEEYADVFGHADSMLVELFGKLIVFDLKSGKGKSVDPESPQLRMYAAMAAGEMIETYEEIITVVIQPRDLFGDPVKTASHDPAELKRWIEDVVLPAIDDSRSEEPTFRASEEGCLWCNYKGQCRAHAQYVLTLATEDFADCEDFEPAQLRDPSAVSSGLLAKIYEHTSLIKNWLESVKQEAVERMLKGDKIPGYKVVRSRTNRRWNQDLDLHHILRKELKIRKMDLYHEKMNTPKQVLDMFEDKEHIRKRINELIIKPEGAPTIAKDTDRRPALTVLSAEEEFKDV